LLVLERRLVTRVMYVPANTVDVMFLLVLKEENAQKLTTFIDTLNGKEGKDITR
jgi:hypothetical protein